MTPSTERAKKRRVVAGQRGLARAPEAREVDRVDPVVAAERRRGVEERRLGAAEAVQQQDVGPLADRQRRDAVAALLDVVDAQQRRAAVGEAEHALEADRQVEVAAGVEAALRERLDAGEVTAPQREPGLGVGADDDVGPAAGDAGAHAGAVGRTSHLPRVADVAEPQVVGRVEVGVGAEIARRQAPERLLHLRKARHGADGTGRVGPHGLRSRTVRTISLHDSRSGQVTALEPRDPGRVGIYACGPTVYSRVHVGNARPYVVFSLLKRFLEHEGLEATLVANITDINDKIYAAARDSRGRLGGAGRRDDRALQGRHRAPRASAGPTTSRWPRSTSRRSWP